MTAKRAMDSVPYGRQFLSTWVLASGFAERVVGVGLGRVCFYSLVKVNKLTLASYGSFLSHSPVDSVAPRSCFGAMSRIKDCIVGCCSSCLRGSGAAGVCRRET